MKYIITLLLATLIAPTAFAADKVMKAVDCSIDFTSPRMAKNRFSGVEVLLTDKNPTDSSESGPNTIWKRVQIPGYPNYYLQIWSYPGPVNAEQEIDLRIKTKAQLGQYDDFAWASGYGNVDLGVTLPGHKAMTFEITCGAE